MKKHWQQHAQIVARSIAQQINTAYGNGFWQIGQEMRGDIIAGYALRALFQVERFSEATELELGELEARANLIMDETMSALKRR